MKIEDVLKEEFYSNIKDRGEGCWIWTGHKTGPMGYGGFFKKELIRKGAHIFSWLMHRGEIPDGMFVCHKCDVPPCVNPDHLFLGTNAENIKDSAAKGRQSKNLDKSEVLEIVDLYNYGFKPSEIAIFYNVTHTSISEIINGVSWESIVDKKITIRNTKAGRPREYDEGQAKKIIQMSASGMSVRKIAHELDVGKSTIARILKEAIDDSGLSP